MSRLIVTLSVCLVVGAVSRAVAEDVKAEGRRKAALELIQKLGGKAEIDSQSPGKPVVKVSIHCTAEVRDEDLRIVAQGFPELRTLTLEGYCKESQRNHLTDAGLKHLRGLPQLESLNLSWHKQITDAGVEHLATLVSLKHLNLTETGVTKNGGKRLRKALPNAVIHAEE